MKAFKGAAKQGGGFNWGNAALGLFGGADVVAALQRRREAEQQRQQVAAQQGAAQALGFTKDEIAAMSPEALSWTVYQRIAQRAGGGEDGDSGGAAPSGAGVAMLHGHEEAMPPYAPPPGSPPPDPALTRTSGRFFGSPGFDAGAAPATGVFQTASFADPRWKHIPALADIPRAQSHAHAASLPRGSYFLAPDASLRRII